MKSKRRGGENKNCDREPVNEIAAAFGIGTTNCRDILRAAGVPTEGGAEFKPAAVAIYNYKAKQLEGPELEAAADRARKAKAEADAAEIDTAKKKGELVVKADVDMMWQDAIQQGVENVSALPGLIKAQKQSVFAAIRKIKLKEDGE